MGKIEIPQIPKLPKIPALYITRGESREKHRREQNQKREYNLSLSLAYPMLISPLFLRSDNGVVSVLQRYCQSKGYESYTYRIVIT